MSDSVEGKIQVQADLIPTNLNPRMAVTDAQYVKGAGQTFQTISELVAFHPNKMRLGMPATVMNWPTAGTITDFRLATDPFLLIDSGGNTVVTSSNFQTFWAVQTQTKSLSTRVYNYSPNGPGGGAPVFPYTLVEESNWSPILDPSKGHKWLRFRDDDVDSNVDGIFDNWSVPIGIAAQFTTGDYVENRFLRQAVSATLFSSSAGMITGKYYIVQSGTVTLTGTLTNSDIDWVGTGTTTDLTIGKVFKHDGAVTLTFNSASVNEIVKAPPRAIAGLPNNEPVGWSDTIPGGSVQLWEITAQKSVYGQLKTPWILSKIAESPEYVRYSDSPSPHPDTIAGVNTTAAASTPGDTNLIAAGWLSVYDNQNFMATRSDDPGPNLFTSWLVQKINEESGEYIDRVFKLFDINLPMGSIFLVPPTNSDATKDGWSDTPVQETSTQINYVSQARKFIDGTLKTPWSAPVPYTGADTFIDDIVSDLGDNFKYTQSGTVSPSQISLTAEIYKGTNALWPDTSVVISYAWVRVYNNGAIDTATPTTNPADPFYKLGASPPIRANQQVVIKPSAVTGMAVFQCTQTITLPVGDPIVFVDEFTVLDVTDGKDVKDLSVTADTDRTVFDTVNYAFSPSVMTMRAYSSNIGSPTLYWYRWNGSAWVTLTGDTRFTLSGNTAAFQPGPTIAATAMVDGTQYVILFQGSTNFITYGAGANTVGTVFTASGTPGTGTGLVAQTGNVFASDATAEEQRFAVSTHATNPDLADFLATFSDYITMVKLGAASTGVAGQNAISAILNNESHTVQLDSSVTPIAGEIGIAGKAITTLLLYDGTTKKNYGGGADYTIAVASDNGSVTFAYVANGTDVDIYVNTWTTGQRRAVCTITVTYGVRTVTKKFSVSSALDAPFTILLDIDSSNGYVFTPIDKSDKTLIANLYDTGQPASSQLISSIVAGNFVVGRVYVILTAGSTNFVAIGSANNTPGTTFTAIGVGSGTGTAIESIWTFRWNVNSTWSAATSLNRTRIIHRSDILSAGKVTVEAYKSGVLYRSITVNMTDVNDGHVFRGWTDNASKPTGGQLLIAQNPTTPSGSFGAAGNTAVTVGGVAWYLATATYWASHIPTFAQDAEESSGVYSWGNVYQLKGEKGDQGPNGNFFHAMYIKSVPTPSLGAGGTVSTITQQRSAGWRTKITDLAGTNPVWKTEALWTGAGVTFDGNGDPSTSIVAGGAWSYPVQISGSDGVPGSVGVTGSDGPQGIQGIQGVQGIQGPAGVTQGVSAFVYTTANAGDLVSPLLTQSSFDPTFLANTAFYLGTVLPFTRIRLRATINVNIPASTAPFEVWSRDLSTGIWWKWAKCFIWVASQPLIESTIHRQIVTGSHAHQFYVTFTGTGTVIYIGGDYFILN